MMKQILEFIWNITAIIGLFVIAIIAAVTLGIGSDTKADVCIDECATATPVVISPVSPVSGEDHTVFLPAVMRND